MNTQEVLKVEGVDAYYSDTKVLHNVSIKLLEGETVTLVGSNGAGKTTTLKCIAGIVHIRSGRIVFENKIISGLRPNKIAELGISLVPEGRGLFTGMTVKENLELGAFTKTARSELKATLEKVYNLFPILKERSNQQAGSLSGGEQQMLAIGRALMSRPKLLILDEPSLGLAPVMVRKVFEALKALKEEKIRILLVEQNLDVALSIADRGYLMENGRIVFEDYASNFKKNEIIRQSYLGL